MSETATKGQDFESSLSNASGTVAEFDAHSGGVLMRIQHILHGIPSLVPLIVLVISVLGIGIWIDWEAIKDLLWDAWQMSSPKKLVAEHTDTGPSW